MAQNVEGTVKVGLIGGGGITRAHVKGYRQHAAKIGVTAVADVVEEAANERAEELGAQAFTDYREMLATADIERGRHLPAAPPARRRHRGGGRGRQARPVREAVVPHRGRGRPRRRSGPRLRGHLMCAHNQLFFPSVAKAKELLDSGILGTVYEVRTTDSFHNDFDPSNMGWRASAKTSGGGELIDTGYHPTYLLLHLADAQPTEATAFLSTHRLKFMEGEDSAQVLVRSRTVSSARW